MQSLIDDILATTAMPWPVAAMRLLGACLLCGLIGFEREARSRPAGLRTHMLVGLAAALYTLITLDLLANVDAYTDRVAMDPIRLIEAVTAGVAFLAAGMIVFAKGKVRGLTTGTSLWLAAAVGLACGFGMWSLAITTTALGLVIISLIKMAEEKAMRGGADQPPSPPSSPPSSSDPDR